MTYYVALGSNLGDREGHLRRAVEALSLLPGTRLAAVSSVYETDPVGYADQPRFYNAAVRLESGLTCRALLGCCLGIEAAMGRRRIRKDGPRTLDLDLLCGDAPPQSDEELVFPHPRMLERAFVLAPLCEICPQPGYHSALARLDRSGIRRLEITLTPSDGNLPEGEA